MTSGSIVFVEISEILLISESIVNTRGYARLTFIWFEIGRNISIFNAGVG